MHSLGRRTIVPWRHVSSMSAGARSTTSSASMESTRVGPAPMQALVLGDRQAKVIDDQPAPARAPGEALVRVRVSGVCDTDLQLARGYMGFRGIPGHEFVGDVVAAD